MLVALGSLTWLLHWWAPRFEWRSEPPPSWLLVAALLQGGAGVAFARVRALSARPFALVMAGLLVIVVPVSLLACAAGMLRYGPWDQLGPLVGNLLAFAVLVRVRGQERSIDDRTSAPELDARARTRLGVAGALSVATGTLALLLAGRLPISTEGELRVQWHLLEATSSWGGARAWIAVLAMSLALCGGSTVLPAVRARVGAPVGRSVAAVLALPMPTLLAFLVRQPTVRLEGLAELGLAPTLLLGWLTTGALVVAAPLSWRTPPRPAPPERPTRHRRALRIALTAFIVPTLLLGGGLWLYARRPFTSARDDLELRRAVDELLVEARRQRCTRPVLRGDPTPGDGTDALFALLDTHGQFGACLQLGRDHGVIEPILFWHGASAEVRLHELPAEGAESSPVPDDPPPPEGDEWFYVGAARGFHRTPLDAERRLLEACAGIDVEIERIAQYDSVCTPGPFGSVRLEEDEALRNLLALSRVASILARDHMRRGEPRRGFELLLDTAQLMTDAQRGRPQLLVGAMADAGAGLAASQIVGLLAQDQSYSDGDLEALERQASVLASQPPHAWRRVFDDGLTAAIPALRREGWTPPAGLDDVTVGEDEMAADPMVADGIRSVALALHRRLDHLCDPSADEAACRAAFDRELSRARAARPRRPWAAVLARLAHGAVVDTLYAEGSSATSLCC